MPVPIEPGIADDRDISAGAPGGAGRFVQIAYRDMSARAGRRRSGHFADRHILSAGWPTSSDRDISSGEGPIRTFPLSACPYRARCQRSATRCHRPPTQLPTLGSHCQRQDCHCQRFASPTPARLAKSLPTLQPVQPLRQPFGAVPGHARLRRTSTIETFRGHRDISPRGCRGWRSIRTFPLRECPQRRRRTLVIGTFQ